jgi:hypothetical protein
MIIRDGEARWVEPDEEMVGSREEYVRHNPTRSSAAKLEGGGIISIRFLLYMGKEAGTYW